MSLFIVSKQYSMGEKVCGTLAFTIIYFEEVMDLLNTCIAMTFLYGEIAISLQRYVRNKWKISQIQLN